MALSVPQKKRSGRRSFMGFWKKCKGWSLGVLIGAAFLGLGAAQGQLEVIWRKAVMICLECIGIG